MLGLNFNMGIPIRVWQVVALEIAGFITRVLGPGAK